MKIKFWSRLNCLEPFELFGAVSIVWSRFNCLEPFQLFGAVSKEYAKNSKVLCPRRLYKALRQNLPHIPWQKNLYIEHIFAEFCRLFLTIFSPRFCGKVL